MRIFLPMPPPCRVTAVNFAPGESAPYALTLPRVGELIPAGERVGASLRFRAAGTAELERAVRAAADGLRLQLLAALSQPESAGRSEPPRAASAQPDASPVSDPGRNLPAVRLGRNPGR